MFPLNGHNVTWPQHRRASMSNSRQLWVNPHQFGLEGSDWIHNNELLVRLRTSLGLPSEGVLKMSPKIPHWGCSLNVFVIVIVFVFAGLCRSAHGNLRFQESQLALGPVFKLPPKRIPGFQDLQKKQSLYCSYCIKTNNQQKITMITNTNSNKKNMCYNLRSASATVSTPAPISFLVLSLTTLTGNLSDQVGQFP